MSTINITTERRLEELCHELGILNRKMQELLDRYGKNTNGMEKIRVLKVKHDKLLDELNSIQIGKEE
jgi:hypothetical protein